MWLVPVHNDPAPRATQIEVYQINQEGLSIHRRSIYVTGSPDFVYILNIYLRRLYSEPQKEKLKLL
jgi:hypothetical protein